MVSRDDELLRSGARLCTFGVLPSFTAGDFGAGPLALLGTTVVDGPLLESVAASGPGAYAGYGNDALAQVADIPSVRSGLYFRVARLDSGADLGKSCVLVGLDDAELEALANDLASVVGVSSETLTAKMSGSTSMLGLLYLFCAAAFATLSLVLALLMVTRSLLELKTLGVHLMLGWSKADFVCELLSSQALQALVALPVGFVGAFATFDGFEVNGPFVGFALASALPAVLVVLVSAGVASVPFLSVRPVEAICDRYSRRGFYALVASMYLVCLAIVFAGCIYIDQPLVMYAELSRAQSSWSDRAGWYVVRDFVVDGAHYTGDTMGLSEELYAWYAEHEHDEGVYLANTSFYGQASIQAYAGADATLEPFWYLAASPSYLGEIGLDVSDDLIEKAERGTRVYLLPESLSATEKEEMEEFLTASRKVYDSDITTAFMENPTYEFTSYDASNELFTWSTDSELPTEAGGFVIAIVTSENMVPFESESLIASGLENAYVKLGEVAAANLLDENGTASLEGSIGVRFTTVGNYIEGLQKTLEELFALFSAVLVIMLITIAVMVACLVDVVNRVNAREVCVKYILGFGAWEIYGREIVLVSAAALLGTGASAASGSKAGVIVGVSLLAISNLVIVLAARRRSPADVLETVSKE